MVKCPNCEQAMRERSSNFLRNLRLRSTGDPHDKYVCENCEATYSSDDVFDEERMNIVMKKWLNE